ncbi:MAG TPA: alpha/beta hydrolase [Polyangiaceae bacterium]
MLTRRDGSPLAGYLSDGDGPVLVLANGLGGPVAAFRHQLDHFKSRFRVLTWDYRGLYASRCEPPPERVDVAAQADDLEDLLAALGAASPVLVGWSMGVQVVLELCRRAPERASHLVLINGTAGRPLASTRLPGAGLWLPGLVERLELHHRLGSRLVSRLSESSAALALVRGLGIVSPRIGPRELYELACEFREIDFQVYFRTLRALGDHDASDDLSRVTTRALVMTGARDPVFSPSTARELARRLRNAELYVVPKATHYAPLEYPELVNARIDAFLAAPNPRPA